MSDAPEQAPVPKKPILSFRKAKDLPADLFKTHYDMNAAHAKILADNLSAHLGDDVNLELSVEQDDTEVRFYVIATIKI